MKDAFVCEMSVEKPGRKRPLDVDRKIILKQVLNKMRWFAVNSNGSG
jgi:hypothetical protein